MKYIFTFFVCLLWTHSVYGQLVSLEVDEVGVEFDHAKYVNLVACGSFKNADSCWALKKKDFLDLDMADVDNAVAQSKVINMSFAYQQPPKPTPHRREGSGNEQNEYEKYYQRKENIEGVIKNNPNKLFVVAAGNGFNIAGLQTKMTPLSRSFPVYPALFNYTNMIKVTSLDTAEVIKEKLEFYVIDDYANYSIFHVDVAAPVETLLMKDEDGKIIKGTSFAAPYVSRLADKIQYELPGISPEEVREIFLRSCYVKNIDRAIWVTEDYVAQKEQSVIHKVHVMRNRKKREALLEEVSDIMLVKCGGPLVESVVEACTANYKNQNISIEQACLQAQKNQFPESYTAKLPKFWSLRKI